MLTQEDLLDRVPCRTSAMSSASSAAPPAALLVAASSAPPWLRWPLRISGVVTAFTAVSGWCPVYHATGLSSIDGPWDRPAEAQRDIWLATAQESQIVAALFGFGARRPGRRASFRSVLGPRPARHARRGHDPGAAPRRRRRHDYARGKRADRDAAAAPRRHLRRSCSRRARDSRLSDAACAIATGTAAWTRSLPLRPHDLGLRPVSASAKGSTRAFYELASGRTRLSLGGASRRAFRSVGPQRRARQRRRRL